MVTFWRRVAKCAVAGVRDLQLATWVLWGLLNRVRTTVVFRRPCLDLQFEEMHPSLLLHLPISSDRKALAGL